VYILSHAKTKKKMTMKKSAMKMRFFIKDLLVKNLKIEFAKKYYSFELER